MIIDAERLADRIESARPIRLAPIARVVILAWIALFAGVIIGRATAPDRGMTWAEVEAMVCPAPADTMPSPKATPSTAREIEL